MLWDAKENLWVKVRIKARYHAGHKVNNIAMFLRKDGHTQQNNAQRFTIESLESVLFIYLRKWWSRREWKVNRIKTRVIRAQKLWSQRELS